MLRGAWAIYAATEQDIEALERELTVEADVQARKVAVYGAMLKALRKEGCSAPRVLVDEVGRVDQVLPGPTSRTCSRACPPSSTVGSTNCCRTAGSRRAKDTTVQRPPSGLNGERALRSAARHKPEADGQRRAQLPGGQAPDAVILIRGGGAVNDLAWLNDYVLARFPAPNAERPPAGSPTARARYAPTRKRRATRAQATANAPRTSFAGDLASPQIKAQKVRQRCTTSG